MNRLSTDLFQNASDSFKALHPEMFPLSVITSNPTDAPPKDDQHPGPESLLQIECTNWLQSKGYKTRSPDSIAEKSNGKWYIHLHEAQCNPIILDLILLDSRRNRYIEIELKVQGGKLRPSQRALIGRGEGFLCWNMDQFKAIVTRWENE